MHETMRWDDDLAAAIAEEESEAWSALLLAYWDDVAAGRVDPDEAADLDGADLAWR